MKVDTMVVLLAVVLLIVIIWEGESVFLSVSLFIQRSHKNTAAQISEKEVSRAENVEDRF